MMIFTRIVEMCVGDACCNRQKAQTRAVYFDVITSLVVVLFATMAYAGMFGLEPATASMILGISATYLALVLVDLVARIKKHYEILDNIRC